MGPLGPYRSSWLREKRVFLREPVDAAAIGSKTHREMNTRRVDGTAKTDSTLPNVLLRTKTITFDCYGTLIDWRAGVVSSLTKVFGDLVSNRADEVSQTYVETEAKVEAEDYQSYPSVMAAAERTTRSL